MTTDTTHTNAHAGSSDTTRPRKTRTGRLPGRLMVGAVASVAFGAGFAFSGCATQRVEVLNTGQDIIYFDKPVTDQSVGIGMRGATQVKLKRGEWVVINDEISLRIP